MTAAVRTGSRAASRWRLRWRPLPAVVVAASRPFDRATHRTVPSVDDAVEPLNDRPERFLGSLAALGKGRGVERYVHCGGRIPVLPFHDDRAKTSRPLNAVEFAGSPNGVQDGEAGPLGKAKGGRVTGHDAATIQ